jgi:flagellar hook-basal body complex protein FliE
LVWITKLFVNGIEPEAVKKLRTLEGFKTMLSELAKKVNQNAIKAAKADNAYLEGEQKGKLDTAKAMLRDGVPLATVIRCTGLTEDQLAREMKKDSGV